MDISGKTAVVTGAGRGIGRAVALILARAGVNVVAAARRQADLDALVDEISAAGQTAMGLAADLSREEDVRRLHQKTLEKFGDADILVNNVGVGKYGTLANLSVEDYDRMMNTNMRSTFLCTKIFLPAMLKKGAGCHVLFVASVASLRGLPSESVYCASKAAQYAFAQSLDYETRPAGVKVSVVAPGGVNTDFALGDGRTKGDPVLEEMLDAEDVAEAVLFALSQPQKSRTFLIGMRPMNEAL